MHTIKAILTQSAISLMLFVPSASAVTPLPMLPPASIEADCRQLSGFSLNCDYRFTEQVPLYSVSASIDGLELPTPQQSAYPEHGDGSAILFLIDTSDPARNTVVQKNLLAIEAFLGNALPHQAFGLATFDSELRMEAPIGSAHVDIVRIGRDIQASGKTTELYRNTIVAIRHLKRYPAQRKAIYLFSDGLAEDRAYHNNDVVKAARDAGVVIYSFGYARNSALSVAMQSLRRLSDETGGRFSAADASGKLPDEVVRSPFALLDSGGRLAIDLSAVRDAGIGGMQTVQIAWETQGGIINTFADVELPTHAKPAQQAAVGITDRAAPAPAAARAAATPAASPARAGRTDPFSRWLVYGVWSLAGLVALLIFLWALNYEIRRIRARRKADEQEMDRISYAFLEMLDGTGVRYPIRTTAFRIGRHSENDLRLADNTISRHHAEILRRRDGTFSITDLDSINGVVVNDRNIKTAVLQEGDVIECGDISLRFSLSKEGEPGDDETVLLKTKVPYLEAS